MTIRWKCNWFRYKMIREKLYSYWKDMPCRGNAVYGKSKYTLEYRCEHYSIFFHRHLIIIWVSDDIPVNRLNEIKNAMELVFARRRIGYVEPGHSSDVPLIDALRDVNGIHICYEWMPNA